jgi:phosphoglycolate phosphatase-like HAD superfamily hydrolase
MRLILWDIDHTLIDPGDAYLEATAAALYRTAGIQLLRYPDMTGRTERAISAELLRLHGIQPDDGTLAAYLEAVATEMTRRGEAVRSGGRVLPGAAEILRAASESPDLAQTVLTGNGRALAELKLSIFGLASYLDLDIGAYGDDSEDRASLPPVAWGRAGQHRGLRVDGRNTVIVGDSVQDVLAARKWGIKVITVATGPTSAEALAAAGADLVLDGLAGSPSVLAAILGR